MYIYFDTNGTIKEIVNDKSIRNGSNEANKIYCYLEGEPEIDDIWYLQKLPSGELSNEVSFKNSTITKAIPYDAKRDMKYFKDFEQYTFYVFTLNTFLTSQKGLNIATIRVSVDNTIWALGELTFNVQENVINVDNGITQSQYDYLLLAYASRTLSEQTGSDLDDLIDDKLNAKLGDLASGSPKVFDTEANIEAMHDDEGIAVATDTGYIYVWNDTQQGYVSTGMKYIADVSLFYTKTQSDNTFAPKSTAVYHSGSQLQDGSGTNLYPTLETITNLKIDLPLEDVYKVNHLESAGGNINASIRFLANDIIEKNVIIKSVDMYVGTTSYSSGTIYLEIWEKVSSTAIERKFTTNVTNNNTTGTINIPVNYVTTASAYIVVYRVGTFLPQIVYNASETNGVLFISDISSTTLTLASFSQYSGHLCLKANCTILKNTQKLANTIYVGQNGDFTTIQEAINSIVDDASNNPYTIIVDKGTYARFSMRSSVTGISRMRYISIIGIDKMACVIYDDTGHYVTGSCDYWGQGSIENLTIKVDHTNDISEANRKAYALHMDFGQCNVVVRNCILKSSNGPAVGIGLYQDTTITFEDCDIYSDCPSDYTALLNYGSLFCHGNTSSGTTNQVLNVYNCRIISENSDRGAWISNPGHNSVTINSINTLYYTGAVGGTKVVLDDVTVSPYSYGNSASNLNN